MLIEGAEEKEGVLYGDEGERTRRGARFQGNAVAESCMCVCV